MKQAHLITLMRPHRTTMLRYLAACMASVGILMAPGCNTGDWNSQAGNRQVGPTSDHGTVVSTGQVVRPAGDTLTYSGRPLDLALSPDARWLYVKDTAGLIVVDASTWQIRQQLAFSEDGGSMHGIAVSRDGRKVYLTGSRKQLWEATIDASGRAEWSRQIDLPGPKDGNSHALGMALSSDGTTAYVCLSRNNTLGVVDLAAGKLVGEIDVGICPFDVALLPDGRTAYISSFGGPRPQAGQRTAESTGSQVVVDERGIAAAGTVSKVDLQARSALREIPVGLHPADVEMRSDGTRLYVANANSDTVSIIDTSTDTVIESVLVHPDAQLPFGSISNALALSADQQTLYVANAGNNAVAVITLAADSAQRSAVRGFVPTAWFPGAVVTDGKGLFVANVRGDGSRRTDAGKGGAFDRAFNSRRYQGSLTRVDLAWTKSPKGSRVLEQYTAQVHRDARVPQVLRAAQMARAGAKPRPVPERVGEPSVFQHIVYVIKENRTYDQMFGDLPQGNGDPELCIYGRKITPNHHALAEQFVLLDNYYCNGVVSADGHQWATQGIVTDYQEKGFGGWTRSYDFGTDALCYASSDFLWDSILLAGLSFRNYGEFDFPQVHPRSATWFDVYRDFVSNSGRISFRQKVDIEVLRRYTSPTFPGWEMRIPDVHRVEQFLKEFREAERTGQWPNLLIVYLPQDHTSGADENAPTPNAHLADNDLALGRLVEAISHSRFWPDTCLFVNEDDPQDGFDHVDGHRSICLVISPYTRRGEVVSRFYNQTSVLHTITRIFGLSPLNQQVAQSPTMEHCFSDTLDPRPYVCLGSNVPLDQPNPRRAALSPAQRKWAEASAAMDLSLPDRINDDTFNRILWHIAKGAETPYPAHLAGAHGRGLRALGLKLSPEAREDEDDDD